MKKIILLILIFFMIVFLNNYKEYNISDNEIRFRVISNSNNTKDIIMKEKVVKELSEILFINSDNKEKIRENIFENLDLVQNKIENLFKNNNYDKEFKISYGLNEFPKKEFMNKIYPKGEYESLVIEIGEAKGNNYFCILYPSLCMIDYNNKEEKKEYGFKILDLFNDIF